MYGTELAELMDELGAHTAFNLDGGGSSQMWQRGRGTISQPSDGTPRDVFNHWGVFAEAGHDRGRLPSSCDYSSESVYHQPAGTLRPETTDVDGDGRADACMRTQDGLACHLADGDDFSSSRPTLELDDDGGDAGEPDASDSGDADGESNPSSDAGDDDASGAANDSTVNEGCSSGVGGGAPASGLVVWLGVLVVAGWRRKARRNH